MTGSDTVAVTTNVSAELLTAAQVLRTLAQSLPATNHPAIETAHAIADSLLRNAAACVGLEALIQALPPNGPNGHQPGQDAVAVETGTLEAETIAEEEAEADEGD